MTKLTREYSKDLNILYVEDDKELCHSTRDLFEIFLIQWTLLMMGN